MKQAKRIEIFGGIASGKTTLAELLWENSQSSLARENFRENPFWKRFYEQPFLFAHEKNVCFLAQHTGEIKAAGNEGLIICDYAVFQDLAYASLAQENEHLAIMEALYQHLYKKLNPPTLFIYLECNAEEQLRRIRSRGRHEEYSITLDYLASLNQAIQKSLNEHIQGVPLQVIRSDEIDFATDPQQRLRLKSDVLSMISGQQEEGGADVLP